MEWIELINIDPGMVQMLVAVIGAIFAHAVIVIAVKIYKRAFKLKLMPDFLAADVAPYGLVMVGLGIGAILAPEMVPLYHGVGTAIIAAHVAKIYEKLQMMNITVDEDLAA